MTDDSIAKQVIKNLGQVAAETGKEIVSETGKITESIITGKELLGDIKPLTPEEEAQKKQEEERRKQKEMNRLRNQMGQGRNVGKEIEEIHDEKEKKEKEEEEKMLEQVRQQREAEERERQEMAMMDTVSTNPAKQKKARGSALAHGKKKSQPDESQMSQTNEFKGGKID